MKKFIFLILLSGIFLAGNAQHTLSFNQCLLVTSTPQSVPSGRAWKIVSVLPSSKSLPGQNASSPSTAITNNGDFDIVVNGNTIYLSSVDAGDWTATGYSGSSLIPFTATGSGLYNAFTNVNGKLFPMWLPAGISLAAGHGISSVSVIEFVVN